MVKPSGLDVAVVKTLSVTLTVTVNEPNVLGVPEISPFVARVTPVGKLPESSDHVYGGTPPDADSVALYGVFCIPFGNDVVLTTSAGADAWMVNGNAPDDAVLAAESCTCSVTENEPLTVGVPDTVPFPVPLRPTPDGKAPAITLHVYPVPVPPLADSVTGPYAVPCVPFGSPLVRTVRVGAAVIVNDRLPLFTLCPPLSATWMLTEKLPD